MDAWAQDEAWVRRALGLAREAAAFASPNPTVGCVLARDGAVLGEGAHRYEERDHAEIVALKQAHARVQYLRGATAYVTLEPCSHHGRTGPCADALVAAGVARCVVATADPNPLVRGRGVAKLRASGVQVDMLLAGAYESPDARSAKDATARHGEVELVREARQLNEAFAFAIQSGRPFVTLKAAVSVDGRLAPAPGTRSETKPHWLTGEAARVNVQWLRHASDAILTGIGTVLADDPALSDRTGLPRRRPLLRVLLDAALRTPVGSQMVRSAAADVLVLCGEAADVLREAELISRGVQVVRVSEADGRLALDEVLELLQQRGVRSVLAEGGSRLNGELLRGGLVDKAVLYYAACELGIKALPFAENAGSVYELQDRLTGVERVSFAHGSEEDVRVSGYLRDPWAGVSAQDFSSS